MQFSLVGLWAVFGIVAGVTAFHPSLSAPYILIQAAMLGRDCRHENLIGHLFEYRLVLLLIAAYNATTTANSVSQYSLPIQDPYRRYPDSAQPIASADTPTYHPSAFE